MTWGSTWWAAKQKIPVHQPKWASFHKCDWSFTPHILTALQQPPSSHTDGKIQSRWARRQDWRKAVESQCCCSSLEDGVPLTLWHGSVSIETLKHGSWAWARIPPHTHTHKLLCVHLCLLHTQTHSCLLAYLIDHVPSKAGALPETTNKVSYLPLVPALFYQVTTLVSLLLSASLTLLLPLPLSLSLPLFLSVPNPPLPSLPSLSPLVDKPACWVCSLTFFPLEVTVVLSPPLLGSGPVGFNLDSFWRTAGSFKCLNCVTVYYDFCSVAA